MIQNEWTQRFLKDAEAFRNIILSNSTPNKDEFPRYILRPGFFEQYEAQIEKNLKDSLTNHFLKFSNFQEYRAIKLIHCLQKSHRKFQENQSKKSNEVSESSQMIRVNSIIKNSYELTSLINILEWLQGIYLKDDPIRTTQREKIYFEKTVEKLARKSPAQQSFHPDLLNEVTDLISDEDKLRYDKICDLIIMFIRQGKLREGQRMAEECSLFYLSGMLEGGLPMNDFVLDKLENFESVDFDLFPPYMKNTELSQIKSAYESINPLNQVARTEDKVMGNPNWLLWLDSVYESAETKYEERFSHTYHIKLIASYLSGNSSFIDSNTYSVYDSIYTQILGFLNSKLIEAYLQQTDIKEYQFNDIPDMKKFTNNRAKTMLDLLFMIKSSEKFIESQKYDFMIDFEMDMIELHVLENLEDSQILYYDKLQQLLLKMIQKFTSNEFEEYLNTHYSTQIDTLKDSQLGFKFSKNENQSKAEANILLIKLNYWRIFFTTMISFYSTHSELFLRNEAELEPILRNIYQNYDLIVNNYVSLLSSTTNNPMLIVYISSFCLDIATAERSLSALARSLSSDQLYQSLVKEIDIHFREFQEQLNTCIANNTNIYQVVESVATIDNVLDRYLKEQIKICYEDQNKINQVQLLFNEGRIDKMTIIKFVLKLALKFLANNKFYETQQIVEENFADLLSMENVLDDCLKKDLHERRIDFVMFLENISSYANTDYSFVGMYFMITLIKAILNCFFTFYSIFKDSGKGQRISSVFGMTSDLKAKVNQCIGRDFKHFIKLYKIYIVNIDIADVIINVFSEEVYREDVMRIFSKWIYQVLKWTVDLYTNEDFHAKKLLSEDSITAIEDLLTNDSDTLIKYYLIDPRTAENFLNEDSADRGVDFLELERTFYRSMDNRKNVPSLIYTLSKGNRRFLSEVLDNKMRKELEDEINNYEF